jgi:hypothetical protein
VKRWALRICVFLLLGAIVNVAVAWTCTRFARFSEDVDLGEADVFALFAGREMLLRPSRRLDGHLQHGGGLRMTEADAMESQQADNGQWSAYLLLFDAGWPLTTLRAEWRGAAPMKALDASIHLYRGMETSGEARDGQFFHGRFVYPTEPIWPGFAINTLFYAGVLWLLFAGPFALRRRRRIKRGLCPKCAYPIGDSAICTECGAPVRSAASTAMNRN